MSAISTKRKRHITTREKNRLCPCNLNSQTDFELPILSKKETKGEEIEQKKKNKETDRNDKV